VGGFSPDGRIVALGGLAPFEEMARAGEMDIWDSNTGESLGRLLEPHAEPRSSALSADGLTAATGYKDGSVNLWSPPNAKVRFTFTDGKAAVDALALTANGKTLAAGDSAGMVRIWDTASRELRATLKGHTGSVSALIFTAETILLSAGEDGTLRRWDVGSGMELGRSRAQDDPIRAISLGGQKLATLGRDGTVQLWNPADLQMAGRVVKTAAARSIALSADGATLALGGRDGVLRIYDIAAEREKETFAIGKGEIISIAFLPKGWACVTSDGAVRLLVQH
jgi:WD40 repeat protein